MPTSTRTNVNGQVEIENPGGGWILATSIVPPPDGMLAKLNATQQSLLQSILSAIQAIVPATPQPTQVFRTTFTETPLTAVGVTTTRTVSFSTNILFQLTISGTVGTTTVRGEGSLNGSNWCTLGDDALDISYTANGTYAIASNLILNQARFRVVAIPVGATVSVVMLVGGANNG